MRFEPISFDFQLRVKAQFLTLFPILFFGLMDTCWATQLDPDETNVNVVRCSGVIKIIDSIQIPAVNTGLIESIPIRESDLVKKGQVVAQIKSDEPRLLYEQARQKYEISNKTAESDVDVRFAQKSLEVAKSELNRALASNSRIENSVPEAEVEKLQLEVHRQTLQLEQSKRDLEIARMKVQLDAKDMELKRLELERAKITSPIDGMVIAVKSKPGEWVQPGQTVLQIVRLNRLKLEGFVSAVEASQIHVGAHVTGVVKGRRPQEFVGRVIFKNPEANTINSTIQIWVEVDNSEMKLTPGLAADMQIEVQTP